MFGLRMPELLIIFAIVLLVFGANRVPQLGKALGETIRGFKKAVEDKEPEEAKQAPPPAQLPNRSVAAASTIEAEKTAAPAEKRA